jgi:hypothetical protein
MPQYEDDFTNVIQAKQPKAIYFRLKRDIETQEQDNFQTITKKAPGLVRWNKELNREVFCSRSIGGNLASILIAEPVPKVSKEGKKFTVHEIFFEFHKQNPDGSIKRAMLTADYTAMLTKQLISKLVMVNNYSKIILDFGMFIKKMELGDHKGEDRETDYVNVYDGTKGNPSKENKPVKKGIIFDYEQKDYPDYFKSLSPREYLKIENNEYMVTTDYKEAAELPNGSKMKNPKYEAMVDSIYREAVDTINSRLHPLVDTSGGETAFVSDAFDEAEQADTQPNPIDGEVYENTLPEINIDDIDIETGVVTIKEPVEAPKKDEIKPEPVKPPVVTSEEKLKPEKKGIEELNNQLNEAFAIDDNKEKEVEQVHTILDSDEILLINQLIKDFITVKGHAVDLDSIKIVKQSISNRMKVTDFAEIPLNKDQEVIAMLKKLIKPLKD